MRAQLDGDAVMITADDFINLHESDAAFVDAGSDLGRKLMGLSERDDPGLQDKAATLDRIRDAYWSGDEDMAEYVHLVLRGRI